MKTYFKSLAVLLPLAFVSSAVADETLDVLPVGSVTYTNVTVTVVTATDVYFTYPGGMGNAKLKNLSPALQEHFHYNKANAARVEDQQAKANIKYQAIAAQQRAQDVQWGTDFDAALKQAKAQKKLVLLDFTGSDWCPWCIKMDQETLSTTKFLSYAADKLVLVMLDFPHNTPQSDGLKRANQALYDRFSVDGFPNFLLLDASGKELGRQVGYLSGGPDAFTAELDGFSKK